MKSKLSFLFLLAFVLDAGAQSVPTNYPVVPFSSVTAQSVASNQDALLLYHWTGSNYINRRISLPNGLTNFFLPPTNSGGTFSNSTVWATGGNVVTNVDLVRDFGARPATVLSNTVIATGSSSLAVANNAFSAGSVGMVLCLDSCGATSNCFTTTVAAYVDSKHVTLAAGVTQGLTNGFGVVGWDCSTNLQNAINLVSNGVLNLHVPNGVYILNGPSNSWNNAQVGVPPLTPAGIFCYQLHIYGDVNPWIVQALRGNNYPANVFGACFWSTATNLNGGSVLACDNPMSPVYNLGPFPDLGTVYCNAVRVKMENLTWRGCFDNNGFLLNLGAASTAKLEGISIDTGHDLYGIIKPIKKQTWGLCVPTVSSGGNTSLNEISIIGFYNAMNPGEHVTAGAIMIGNCMIALNCQNGYAGGGHPFTCHNFDLEEDATNLYLAGGEKIYLDLFASQENNAADSWTFPGCNVYDSGNGLVGRYIYEGEANNSDVIVGGSLLQRIRLGPYPGTVTNNFVNTTTLNANTASVANYVRAIGPSTADYPFEDVRSDDIGSASIYFSTLGLNPNNQWVMGKLPAGGGSQPNGQNAFFLNSTTNQGVNWDTQIQINPISGAMDLYNGLLTAHAGLDAFMAAGPNFPFVCVVTNGDTAGGGDAIFFATSWPAYQTAWQAGKNPSGGGDWPNAQDSFHISAIVNNVGWNTFFQIDTNGISQFGAGIQIRTNSLIPAPSTWGGTLWNSNNYLYWVTTVHTNLLSAP